jgi:dihydropteroate synthase
MRLACRDRGLDLTRAAAMGVLNVTPDSFSDGGLWVDPGTAVKHGIEMVEQGAAIIDVGGESTRPGAEIITEEEELRRVIPVIEGLAAELECVISIDTRKPSVARAAVAAGAHIVNDTAGEAAEPGMDRVAAETGAAIVVMHSRGTPQSMRDLTDYNDVVTEVKAFLEKRAAQLLQLNVAADAICLDPGFGFAKDPAQNIEMLKRLDELTSLPFPILVGTSRKSFIGAVLDLPTDQRTEGTIATVAWAVAAGARIVRVHDVEPAVRAIRMTEAMQGA